MKQGRPPGSGKVFEHEGLSALGIRTIAEWASALGIRAPTFAKRLRAFEAGKMSLADLITPGLLPTKPPEPNREPRLGKAEFRTALLASEGNIAAAAAALGVSRQTGDALVKRYCLRATVEKLRAAAGEGG